jgi:hypothetical protein
MAPIAPRTFWKEHENKFPALAKVAGDVLSIPAIGAGAERLFKTLLRTKLRTTVNFVHGHQAFKRIHHMTMRSRFAGYSPEDHRDIPLHNCVRLRH